MKTQHYPDTENGPSAHIILSLNFVTGAELWHSLMPLVAHL